MGWLKKILKKDGDGIAPQTVRSLDETKKTEKQPKVKVAKKQKSEMSGEKQEKVKTEKKSEAKTEETNFSTVISAKKKNKLIRDSIAHKVLLGPLVTEKSAISESNGKYSFVTARWATKTQVKKAILDLYGEKAVAINIINIDGRKLNFRRNPGRRSDYKKAIVTLKKGATINIHAGV